MSTDERWFLAWRGVRVYGTCGYVPVEDDIRRDEGFSSRRAAEDAALKSEVIVTYDEACAIHAAVRARYALEGPP